MMKAVILCLVICFPLSLNAELRPLKDESWQFLLLAQFWPGSSCIYFRKEGCVIPPGPDRWTIHGLWPSRNGSEQPEYCNDTMKFNNSEIAVLQNQLDTYWPNYNSTGDRTELWAHEWNKHGTCAFSLPVIQGELKYFNSTLQLYLPLDIYKTLTNANIVPSEDTQYNLKEVFGALVNAYNVYPQIECYFAENKHYLDQIYLCYDKTLQLISCPTANMSNYRRRRNISTLKLRLSLQFESEISEDYYNEQAYKKGQYFVDCPKNGLVYYIPPPQSRA